MPMGMADVATVLFTRFLKFDPARPNWPDRDRFVLSAGHGSMLLYSLLYLTGYADMSIDEIKRFRQLDSRTPGHPEYGAAGGIETTTGPLGQGLANAVGMALAATHLAATFGNELVDHLTYVLAGDGCLMEGISHRYGRDSVLHGLDLTIARGEITCLLGPSGCGKTTSLRVVAGLEPIQGGRVDIAGMEVSRPGYLVPPEYRRVGLMFQDYALFPHMRVIDNVAFGLRLSLIHI